MEDKKFREVLAFAIVLLAAALLICRPILVCVRYDLIHVTNDYKGAYGLCLFIWSLAVLVVTIKALESL